MATKSYKELLSGMQKSWSAPDLILSADAKPKPKIPFSSPQLNYATYGGIPRSAITEFFGDPGGGKTSTAVDICKNARKIFVSEFEQKIDELQTLFAKGNKTAGAELDDLQEVGPKKIVYFDLEHTFDTTWSKKLGITPEIIDVLQPPDVSAEAILQALSEMVQTGEIGLIVLDSIPSLVSQKELDKKFGEASVAPIAGLLTIFLRKIIPLLTRYDCTLLLINQLRDNLLNPYVKSRPGGKALKFYDSLTIYFDIGDPIDFLGNTINKNVENPAGNIITAKIIKQKSAPFDRKLASYYLLAQSGIRVDLDYCKLAIDKYGIIRQGGAWYTLCDPYTGEVLDSGDGKAVKINGFPKVLEYMQANPEYYNKLKQYILDDIMGTKTEDSMLSDSNSNLDNLTFDENIE